MPSAAEAVGPGVVPNSVIQYWSCAVNVRGGACYPWYRVPFSTPYRPGFPDQVVYNRYIYNRVQLR